MNKCKFLDNLGEDEVEAMSHEKYNILVSPLLHLCSRSSVLCHSWRDKSQFSCKAVSIASCLELHIEPIATYLPADHCLYPRVEGRISPNLVRFLSRWELHLHQKTE